MKLVLGQGERERERLSNIESFAVYFGLLISMSVICKLHFERIDRRTNLFEAVERVYIEEKVLFVIVAACLLIRSDTFSQ